MILYIRKNNFKETGGTNLTNRQGRILEELYWTEDFISAEKLAEQFGFSVKTIRNDIAYLKKWLQERNLGKIISKNNAGFQLAITEEKWKIVLKEIAGGEEQRSETAKNTQHLRFMISRRALLFWKAKGARELERKSFNWRRRQRSLFRQG